MKKCNEKWNYVILKDIDDNDISDWYCDSKWIVDKDSKDNSNN